MSRPHHRLSADKEAERAPKRARSLQLCNIITRVVARRHIGVSPTAFTLKILENSDAVPVSVLRRSTKGKTMNDSEVARLRRLRGEALRVREIARAFGSTASAADGSLLSRGACASWRIARVVSGRLKAHPYLRYQRGVGLGSLLRHRTTAAYLALVHRDRAQGLKNYESQLQALARHLDDTRALIWSSDFSDTLGRSQYEIRSLLEDLARVTHSAPPAAERVPKRAPRGEALVGELAQTIDGDWPYLAF
jgi:hypothetical protein